MTFKTINPRTKGLAMITVSNVYAFLENVRNDETLSNLTNPLMYGDCVYSNLQGEHCIVGHWLVNECSLSENDLQTVEGLSADLALKSLMERTLIDDIEPEAIDLLFALQHAADSAVLYEEETSWGDVVTNVFESYSYPAIG